MKELTIVYSAYMLKTTTVKKWMSRFQSGRESVGNDARAGQPATVCNACNIEKVKWEIEKDDQKTIRDLIVPIFRVQACTKFYGRILRWRKCVQTWFWKSWRQNRRKNESSLQKRFWTSERQIWCFLNVSLWGNESGFRRWSIHKMSISAAQEERWTTAQKNLHGSVAAEIDINIIF